MSFDLKPTHPVVQPCCGGTKVEEIVRTEDRDTLPEFLKDKGVSLELWQSTHDDVVSHYKSYYTCCNAFWLNLFWFIVTYGLMFAVFLVLLRRPLFSSRCSRRHRAPRATPSTRCPTQPRPRR